jgi:hypothetical protein
MTCPAGIGEVCALPSTPAQIDDERLRGAIRVRRMSAWRTTFEAGILLGR